MEVMADATESTAEKPQLSPDFVKRAGARASLLQALIRNADSAITQLAKHIENMETSPELKAEVERALGAENQDRLNKLIAAKP